MPAYSARPALERPSRARFDFGGPMGDRITRNIDNWALSAPIANPSMLQIFRDRDSNPPRDLLPWSGEFAGKYLISVVQAARMSRNPALQPAIAAFVADLIATQRDDGYLGPFPAAENMTGEGRWDLWGQYHVMLGLLMWHLDTGDEAALAASRRCADHFCDVFLDTGKRVGQAGWEEMNESSIHGFTLLYALTDDPRYLRLVREIEADWETPPSGDYVRASLEGKAFWQTPKPRWESLHSVQAIAELYFLTGDDRYRRAYEQIWWTIAEGDRHNTGGFSSGEQATGNPYHQGAIETCCTIAWMAVTVDMLRMTGDPRAADELEIATWNGVLGAQHPSGRWWTYNTPMDGERRASAHDIVFQARAGSPELNCCSVNAPRGIGMLSEWAVMEAPNGLAINYYGPFEAATHLPGGAAVKIVQETAYPLDGAVRITVRLDAPARFELRLRIPLWSHDTAAAIGGQPVAGAIPGTYLAIDREWCDGDTVELALDMTPRLWVGDLECAGKASVYTGPLLLAHDPRFDTHDAGMVPPLAVPCALERIPDAAFPNPQPIALYRVQTADGGSATLCDFATAGAAGNPYASWLPVEGVTPAPFSRDNPMRIAR